MCCPLHQKAKQKYAVVIDKLCHSTSSRLTLLSCTLQLYTDETQGTFVDHKHHGFQSCCFLSIRGTTADLYSNVELLQIWVLYIPLLYTILLYMQL